MTSIKVNSIAHAAVKEAIQEDGFAQAGVNVFLDKQVLLGKKIASIGNDNRVIATAHTNVPLEEYCKMYDPNGTGVIGIPEDDWQRYLAWIAKDMQSLLESVDKGWDIGSICILAKNDPDTYDPIIDGGHRTRTCHGFINNKSILTPAQTQVHVKYATGAGKREWFKNLSVEAQHHFFNYRVDCMLIFVLDAEYYEEAVANYMVRKLSDVIVPYSELTKRETSDLDKFTRNQYIASQHGRQNNYTEVRRASIDLDGWMKKHIDSLVRELPKEIIGFKGTRTKRDDYVGKATYTIWNTPVNGNPVEFIGSKNPKDQLDEMYMSNAVLRSRKDVAALRDRSEDMWSRFKRAQLTCKVMKDKDGFSTEKFVEGVPFLEKDGWLLTAFAFDYIYNCGKYNIETDDEEEHLQFLGHFLQDLWTKVDKKLQEMRDLSAGQALAVPSKGSLEYIAYSWANALSRNNEFKNFGETNMAKWGWLQEFFDIHNNDRSAFALCENSQYAVAAG